MCRYTVLAHEGLVVTRDRGLLVFFSGEQPSLDNGRATTFLNAARNLAFVKVPLELGNKTFSSKGPRETGGFYTFNGQWTTVVNEGVTWLTDHTSLDRNVCRIKTAHLKHNTILLLYEIWTAFAFVQTEFMVVDENGKILQDATVLSGPQLGYTIRLPPTDDLAVVDSHAVFYQGGLH